MSNAVIIIQIMFITIGMIVLGMILNYVLGLRKENMSEMRKKALNLQERMRNAQLLNDYQMMAQMQRESMQFMKLMMKKQFVPMCIRCAIFLGIYAILLLIYSDYASGLLPFPVLFFGNGWVALYFLFSIGFSLLIYGVKKLYQKVTGKTTKSQSMLREILGMISPTQQGVGVPLEMTSSTQTQSDSSIDIPPETKESWKDRIED
ncbi:MAG: EMC3/TMCO1 family protein [Promethearchaeota archaeon]